MKNFMDIMLNFTPFRLDGSLRFLQEPICVVIAKDENVIRSIITKEIRKKSNVYTVGERDYKVKNVSLLKDNTTKKKIGIILHIKEAL